MAAYTIEDIELIRRKSGISYQEAVALLDYHNGNVARALVDLERNGRIKPGGGASERKQTEQKHTASSGQSGKGGKSTWQSLLDLLSGAYRARIKVRKDDTPILNFSLLFSLLCVLISPHTVIVGAIVCLVLGYKFSFVKRDPAFAGENLERMVRSAADNVRASVSDFAKGFQEGNDAPRADAADKEQPRSYYAARPAAEPTYRPSAPTLNVPVQVESQDGHVTVHGDDDGYSSATVE